MRYSISESLGYFTEIADDAQLFLRLRGIDKSAFNDNLKIMSKFIFDMKLKKNNPYLYLSALQKKSCDVTSLTIHMALKRYNWRGPQAKKLKTESNLSWSHIY